MSIDKTLKAYKQGLKESQTVLGRLQERAQEIADSSVQAEDARDALSQVESEIVSVSADKDLLKGTVAEATILQDPGLSEMTEEYRTLAARVDELQDEAERLSTIIENCTPDPEQVASLRAEIHKLSKGAGGAALVKEVHDTIEGDSEALREATRACESLLPSVDTLTLAAALPGYEDKHAQWAEYLERESKVGRREQAQKIVDYQLERMLAR